MADDCKQIEKNAKASEKDDPEESIKLYKQAYDCYTGIEREKNANACLDKIAKLLREKAKLTEDPDDALEISEKVVELYNQIGKETESSKTMAEAHKKFIEHANELRAEAKSIEIPRNALEQFKLAIINYKKGQDTDSADKTYLDAADTFNKKGIEIERSKKDLILAIDKYLQASTLYKAGKTEERSNELDVKITGLCEGMGIPLEVITDILKAKSITPIKILNELFFD